MNETSALDDIERQEDSGEPSRLRVALGFFILPMLLVFGAIGVFLLFGLIAHEDKSVDEYLAEVTGGGINEPWQGAFGLANKLAHDESLHRDPGTARRIAAALGHPSAQAAPRVRTFLLLALGSVGHESSVPIVVEYLDDLLGKQDIPGGEAQHAPLGGVHGQVDVQATGLKQVFLREIEKFDLMGFHSRGNSFFSAFLGAKVRPYDLGLSGLRNIIGHPFLKFLIQGSRAQIARRGFPPLRGLGV